MNRHRGKSLVELTVVMACIAVLLLLAGRAIHGLFRAERNAARHVVLVRTLERMESRFRADARAADGAAVTRNADERATLSFRHGNSVRLDYVAGEARVQRVRFEGDERVASDTFRLPGGSAEFQVQPHAGATLASIVVAEAESTRPRRRPFPRFRVDARVGPRVREEASP